MKSNCYLNTGEQSFDSFYPRVKSFLEQDTLDLVIDAQKIRGYRSPDSKSIWIRDLSDMIRGFKYFEKDLTSAIEHFADTQAENGRIMDYFTNIPEKLPGERENWIKYVRVPVEADVEYRFVKAAFLAWQATGDDAWIEKLLPKMERALTYVLTHPWRWDDKLKLVKRAYTIDTWDFAYTAGKHDWLQFQIDENTFWGIMHGDNSGYYQAFRILAFLYRYFKNPDRALLWEKRASELRENMNRICWNGSFYTHFVKLTPVTIEGVDEKAQLSLSNPMDINRGVPTHEMSVAIIREYLARKSKSNAFAEWFSIDPPFPDGIFGDEKLKAGAYINGGIMPLVGGELARAAFEHGFERYGVDILKQYAHMIEESGETYLWYFPDGTASSIETSTSPDAVPTDGWGSSAMLYALFEGLAGVEDKQKLYRKVRLSPRWLAAEIEDAEVQMAYENSHSMFAYQYRFDHSSVNIEIQAQDADVSFHLLLPAKSSVRSVQANGEDMDFSQRTVVKSSYVDFSLRVKKGAVLKINLK